MRPHQAWALVDVLTAATATFGALHLRGCRPDSLLQAPVPPAEAGPRLVPILVQPRGSWRMGPWLGLQTMAVD